MTNYFVGGKNKMAKKQKYSLTIGAKKTLKNTVVMFVLPATLYLLSQIDVFVPEDALPVVVPIAGALSYLVKNYLENK